MSNEAQRTSASLSLSQATQIVKAALVKARALELAPLTVVVLDAGGHVVCSSREDGSGILRFEIAFGKAWGALGMGKPSREIEQISLQRPTFVSSLAAASGGRMIPVAGGVLITSSLGSVIGAVGISGDTSDADETCAVEGVRSANLLPLPNQSGTGEE